MASQSLYRKWRSQTFSDLVGQEATTRTLLNAVREGRLAHAYLFCGPRGTGKTSAARLLAKAINCANPKDGEPCNECLSCREITEGRSPDVIEIDAASNTGVDNIRDLRENVNLLGSGGRYKVYTIDEVHMLSTAAFNALLKTLEEPPPHVIFVLATTEAHKVLPTIVSRCQRFDFRRFTVRTITARLQQVAAGEGLELEPAAADLLARAAQGGMRDALSLLDQAMAYCGARIDLERTRTMLGLADPGAVRSLLDAVADGRAADALHQLNELVVNGADLRQLQQQMGEEWRALLLARAGADVAEVMDRTPDEARDLTALSGRFSLEELMACARVFARSETPARGLPTPQLALELALLECLSIRRNGGATYQPAPAASQPAQRAIPASPAIAPTQPSIAQPPIAQPPRVPAPTQQIELAPPARTSPIPAPASGPSGQVEELDLDAVERELDELFGAERGAGEVAQEPRPLAEQEPRLAPAPVEREAEVAAPAEVSMPTASGGADWLAMARSEWAMVKKVCKQQSPSTAALLSHASPVRCEPGATPVLVIEAQFEFHFEKLKGQKAREAVEWALEQVLGTPIRARFILAGKESGGKPRSTIGANGTNGTNSGGRSAASGPTLARLETAPQAQSPVRPASRSPNGTSDGSTPSANGRLSQQNGHSAPQETPHTTPGGTPARSSAASKNRAPDPAQLEDEARADAIVQEVQRELGAQLLDVRPLDDDDERQ
jgi:DNA polymerase-3 subunit gamma/tau